MEFTEEKVEARDRGLVISNRTKLIELADGSSHIVPVVNSSALKQLWGYTSQDDISMEGDGDGEIFNTSPLPSTSNSDKVYTQQQQISSEKEHVSTTNEATGFSTGPPIKSLKHLFEIISTEESTIEFLRSHKLLARTLECEKCEVPLKTRKYERCLDKCTFYCIKCKKMKSIRASSFFEKSKINLKDVLIIIYLWSTGVPAFICQRQLPEISHKTINDWYSFCRDICIKKFETEPVQFDSNQVSVEVQVDESLFGKKQKYHKGKIYQRSWFFGISDQQQHKCHIEFVPKRDATTLETIIVKHVSPDTNSRIVSDGWSSYSKLKTLGYKHEIVIHEKEFVNEDGFHTNSIESIWSQLKNWMAAMHGVKRTVYHSYLSEFMYRYNFAGSSRGNCLEPLLTDIAHFYKV